MPGKKKFPLALVTGAAKRLGRVFALRLAALGYAVLLHYNTSAGQAEITAEEIRALGVPVYLVQADLLDAASIRAIFDKVDEVTSAPGGDVSGLAVLVNSAAVMVRGDARSLSADDFDATLGLNLRAPFLLAQQACLRMQSGGLVVNISDVGAQKTWSGYPAYTVSKAGLDALTRVLARSFAPKVRVNTIAPGLALAPEGGDPNEWERLVHRLPLQRPAGPDEAGAALEFLIKNEYITGQTIVVDGGYSLI